MIAKQKFVPGNRAGPGPAFSLTPGNPRPYTGPGPDSMDLTPIKDLFENRKQPVSLEFYGRVGDRRSDLLEAFLGRLNREAGIPWRVGSTAGLTDLEFPAFALGSGGPSRHFYQAVPEGPEGPPFLTLVKILAGGQPGLDPATRALLQDFQAPLTITVLITPSCPFCPRMVAMAHQFAAAGATIRTRVVDTLLFPEWAGRYRPKAAPTTILGEEVFLTGIQTEAELAQWLGRLSSAEFLTRLYRNDLLEKRLAEAGERLRSHPDHLLTAARLLTAEEFGIKLGAMALFEEIIETDPGLQGSILSALTPLLHGTSDQVAGDAAFLITRIQDPRKRAVLEGLLKHPNPEIVEIVREGLEEVLDTGLEEK